MYTLSSNDLGYVAIEEEIVETISGVAAMGCYGVVGMVPQNIQSGIGEILGIESVRRGVEANKDPYLTNKINIKDNINSWLVFDLT